MKSAKNLALWICGVCPQIQTDSQSMNLKRKNSSVLRPGRVKTTLPANAIRKSHLFSGHYLRMLRSIRKRKRFLPSFTLPETIRERTAGICTGFVAFIQCLQNILENLSIFFHRLFFSIVKKTGRMYHNEL
jgi:hypothetical protein